LIFVHEGNKGFKEFLKSKCLDIPTVIYTGGGVTNSAKYSSIHPRSYLVEAKSFDNYETLEDLYLKEFIEDWLSKIESDKKAEPDFEILRYGKDSKTYEHIYDILGAFLPLDIELQLENNQDRCINEAIDLLNRRREIRDNLLKLEVKRSVWQMLEDLLKQVKKIKDIKENFEGARQKIFEDFHEKYKCFRDELFDLLSS